MMGSRKVMELMGWLSENGGEHLTAAQMAQYLVLQAVNLNGSLGRLLESSLKPIWRQGERVRNLMPLPLWPDVRDAMEAVIEKQRYKDQPGEWRERGNTKTQASRALRTQGALLWHGLVVVSLNWLHSGGNMSESVGGPGQEGTTLVGITVLPMGWSSAVAIMQCAHRQLALRSEMKMGAGLLEKAEIRKDAIFPALEDTPAWTIYLDDTTIIEKVAKGVSAALEGKPAEEQSKLRKVYEWWGIPTNASKALERVRTAERLCALIDGEKGLLRVTTKRCLDLMSLGAWLRRQGSFPTTALQIYASKAVHILQFRRCLFSALQEVFVEVSQNPVEVRGKVPLFDEMMLLECLLPVVCTDLKAQIDPVVTASDACETGGRSNLCFPAEPPGGRGVG